MAGSLGLQLVEKLLVDERGEHRTTGEPGLGGPLVTSLDLPHQLRVARVEPVRGRLQALRGAQVVVGHGAGDVVGEGVVDRVVSLAGHRPLQAGTCLALTGVGHGLEVHARDRLHHRPTRHALQRRGAFPQRGGEHVEPRARARVDGARGVDDGDVVESGSHRRAGQTRGRRGNRGVREVHRVHGVEVCLAVHPGHVVRQRAEHVEEPLAVVDDDGAGSAVEGDRLLHHAACDHEVRCRSAARERRIRAFALPHGTLDVARVSQPLVEIIDGELRRRGIPGRSVGSGHDTAARSWLNHGGPSHGGRGWGDPAAHREHARHRCVSGGALQVHQGVWALRTGAGREGAHRLGLAKFVLGAHGPMLTRDRDPDVHSFSPVRPSS